FYLDYLPTARLCGKEVEVQAVCEDFGKSTAHSNQYILRVKPSQSGDSSGGAHSDQSFRLMLYSREPLGLEPDDRVSAKLTLDDTYVDMNYHYGDGIYLCAYVNDTADVVSIGGKNSLGGAFARLRAYYKDKLSVYLDEDSASLIKGFLFSDKSGVKSEVSRAFTNCGLQHTMAVSGLHMSIICGSIYSFFGLIFKRRKAAAAAGLASIALMVSVIGFRYSVLRSAVMLAVLFAGDLFSRRADGVNSLFAAASLFVLMNPFCAVDVSFLMSFCSTFGLVIIMPPMNRMMEKYEGSAVRRRLIKLSLPFVQSICATAASLPVAYLFFGSVSLIAPLANMIILPLISLTIILGVVFCLISPIHFAATFIAALCGALCHLVVPLTSFFAGLCVTTVPIASAGFGVFLALVLFVIAAAYLLISLSADSKAYIVRAAALVCVVLLLVTMVCDQVFRRNEIEISLLDSGSGVCTVINDHGTVNMIGAGGSGALYAVQNYEQTHAVRSVSAVILPSGKNTYSQSAENVVKWLKPQVVFMNDDGDKYYAVKAVADIVDGCRMKDVCDARFGEVAVRRPTANAVTVTYGRFTLAIIDKNTSLTALESGGVFADVYVIAGEPPSGSLLQGSAVIYCGDRAVIPDREAYRAGDNRCLTVVTNGETMRI
ncbi:MAG: ComEC/Rec2 family competence protein, partial [Acutalibacteraceae bacterium]